MSEGREAASKGGEWSPGVGRVESGGSLWPGLKSSESSAEGQSTANPSLLCPCH